jgi:sodium/potassium/calcium exchanger 6
LTTYKLPLNEPPKYYFLFTIPGFLCTVLWIYVEANEVVGVLTSLGIFWKIDSVIMGLTFLAWANSVGDFVADVSLAKVGRARTAVS